MRKKAMAVVAAIVLTIMGDVASSEGESEPEPGVSFSPVQVIRPEVEILARPVTIEVQLEPSFGAETSMSILCATSAYRGEVHVERQDTRISISISGEIRELSPEKVLVSYDIEARSGSTASGTGLAASSAAVLEPGKPKSVLTIGGRSLFLTVRFPPEEKPLEE